MAGLKHLEGLANLQKLDLFNANITDVGVECLKGLTSLQFLHLGSSHGPVGATKVTDASVKYLERAFQSQVARSVGYTNQ